MAWEGRTSQRFHNRLCLNPDLDKEVFFFFPPWHLYSLTALDLPTEATRVPLDVLQNAENPREEKIRIACSSSTPPLMFLTDY